MPSFTNEFLKAGISSPNSKNNVILLFSEPSIDWLSWEAFVSYTLSSRLESGLQQGKNNGIFDLTSSRMMENERKMCSAVMCGPI